ncbi:hypothetical protein [Roseovarius pacificus]|uniref:hypothetical protein n=1 Tax=Roseovarius pacificus TaxID=337701 RepID=UPI001E55C3FF|nr:hypothetical protein [Roseovarius pacificus]
MIEIHFLSSSGFLQQMSAIPFGQEVTGAQGLVSASGWRPASLPIAPPIILETSLRVAPASRIALT